MPATLKIKLSVFLFLSVFVLGALISQMKYEEPAVVMTLCGGKAQVFEYFSSDFSYSQRSLYSGGSAASSVRFRPDDGKMQMGHRFDFGGISGETFLVSSIVLQKPGFSKYVLDLKKADQWIKKINQMKKPLLLDNNLLIETTGNDSYLITNDNLFEEYGKKELNISGRKMAYAAVIEILLLVFLLIFPWLVKGVISLRNRVFPRSFLLQSGIFAAVNLIIILPAVYFLCQNIPDVLSITLKAENSFPLEIFYKPPYSGKFSRQISYTEPGSFQNLNIPLPKDAETNRIRLDFGSLPQTISVKSISVIRYGLFTHSVDLEQASEIYTSRNQIDQFNYQEGLLNLSTSGTDPFIVPDPVKYSAFESFSIRFGSVFWMIVGAEFLLLLILSQTIRNLILKISPVRPADKENLLLSLSVAGAFAFIMTFSLPLQTFKMAEEIIQFKINILLDLLYYLVPAVFFGTAAILFLLNKRYGAVFSFLLAAVTIMFAVECGLLSFGLPELNGDFDAYHNVPRMIFHIIVWLAGILLLLCFQKKLSPWLPLVLLAVSVMNGAALVDALMRKKPFEGRGKLIVKSTVNIDGTIEKVKYAPKNNIIMLCLDGVTTESVFQTFMNYPELKKKYPGFTLFTNNIGMNVGTMWGVPGFFTGKLVTPEIPTTEYTSSMYSPDSAVKNYIDRKFALFLRIGLTNLSYIYPDQLKNEKKADLLTPVDGSMLQWLFHELFIFKITPFFWKGKLMNYYFYKVWPNRQKEGMSDLRNGETFDRDENYIYSKLAEAPLLDKNFPGAFHYHHFLGGHQPYKFDKDGKPVNRSMIPWQNDWQGYYERVVFEIKRVANYFQALQNRGLYDDSVIIVLADHGLEPTLIKNSVNPRYLPLLMVKCRNSKSPLNFCNLPTSHTRISAFLKSDDIFSIRQDDIPDLFKTDIRQLAVNRSDLITFDRNGKIIKTEKMEHHLSIKENIKLNFKYSLFNVANDMFPPVAYNGFSEQFQGLLVNNAYPTSSIRFQVSDKSAVYKIEMDAFINNAKLPDASFIITSSSGQKTIFRKGSVSITLQDVRPDKNGIRLD